MLMFDYLDVYMKCFDLCSFLCKYFFGLLRLKVIKI